MKFLKNALKVPSHILRPLILFLLLLLSLSVVTFQLSAPEENALGLVGYYTAYFLLYALGLTIYPLLLFLMYRAYCSIRHQEVFLSGWQTIYLLASCSSLMILLSSAVDYLPLLGSLAGSKIYHEIFSYPSHPTTYYIKYFLGGVPSYILYQEAPSLNLVRLFGRIGTNLIASAVFLLSVTLLYNLHWNNYWNLLRKGIKQVLSALWSSIKGIARLFLRQGTQKQTLSDKIEPETQLTSNKENGAAFTPSFPSPYLHRQASPTQATSHYPAAPASYNPIRSPSPIKVPTSASRAIPQPSPSSSGISPQVHLAGRQTVGTTLSTVLDEEVWNQGGELKEYQLPPASLLRQPRAVDDSPLREKLQQQAITLRETLLNFGIEASVGDIHCGPRITSFEVHPAVGVKVQKIKALENDIALNMQAPSIRIIAPIPGKAAVGIEIPSPIPQEVSFRQLIEEYQHNTHKYQVPVLLGKNVSGQFVGCDLAKMPHAIIAGATGSGKSVCINTLVMSIIMNATPDEVKLVMVDPKKVELTPYSTLPHMLAPVITEPQEAFAALNWLVREMEFRYEVLKRLGFRNIVSFNARTRDLEIEEQVQIPIPEKMFYIVAIIDELADLMMVANQDIETPIARIAQMARAVGIHMVIATQRPSREVLTGLIKANFPTRIAFKVASRVNSQIILDEIGAESLLGNGDMLFLPPGTSALLRAQGAYISDEEIQSVINFITAQRPTNYLMKEFSLEMESPGGTVRDGSGSGNLSSRDMESERKGNSLYEEALQLVLETGNASASFLQRHLRVGYPTAANLIDQLEASGVISPKEKGNRPRRVLGRTGKEDADEQE
jgi:S-DNA-T family DNA segregation ATPase FtsK/SpoIIIE